MELKDKTSEETFSEAENLPAAPGNSVEAEKRAKKVKILRIGCIAAIVILIALIAVIIRVMISNYYASPAVSATATEGSIEKLERFTNLESVDFTGSTDYALIEKYEKAHPDVKVTYFVEIGETACDNHAEELELAAGTFSPDELMEKLQYLPNLRVLKMPETDLTGEQMAALRETYPGIELRYSIDLFGETYENDTAELDMSAMDMDTLPELAEAVKLMPELQSIQLMKKNGKTDFDKADVKAVMDACPGVTVKYSFELFGKELTTEDECVEFSRLSLSDEDATYIREALDILPKCTYFLMDDCGISDDVMASIREAYPNTKVVWRVFFGYFNCLTDTDVIRATHDLTDAMAQKLNYCNEVVYLDVGHNDKLHDVGFVANMPKLKVAILGCALNSIEPLRDHPSIEFLELCFRSIDDISPLQNCKTLKYLNIAFTYVNDLTPIWELPLERLVCSGAKIPSNQLSLYAEEHPDCLFVYDNPQPFGYGWRYNDNGYTQWEYYENLREIFRYDDAAYYTGADYSRVKR